MSCYRDQDLTTVKLLVYFYHYRKIDFQSRSDLIFSDRNFNVSKNILEKKSQNSINYIEILKTGY